MLTLENLLPQLEFQYSKMLKDGIQVGLVGYIGCTPAELGEFFADRFRCDSINLASTEIGNNPRFFLKAARIFRKAVSRLPCYSEPILRAGAEVYKAISKRDTRVFPKTIPLEIRDYHKNLPILLVDDDSFTGRTLEFWKSATQEHAGVQAYTFTITTVGDYRPDYFCMDQWRPFEWRPIGV